MESFNEASIVGIVSRWVDECVMAKIMRICFSILNPQIYLRASVASRAQQIYYVMGPKLSAVWIRSAIQAENTVVCLHQERINKCLHTVLDYRHRGAECHRALQHLT